MLTLPWLGLLLPSLFLANVSMKAAWLAWSPLTVTLAALMPLLLIAAAVFYESSDRMPRRLR